MFPRVPVFDLDGTWWCPDMYELWGGGGAPFRRIAGTDSAMLDKGRNTVQLLDGTMQLVSELWYWSHNHSVPTCADGESAASSSRSKKTARSDASVPYIIAAASTCDEPRWALELLQLFHTRPHPFDKHVLIGGDDAVAAPTSNARSRHTLHQKNAPITVNNNKKNNNDECITIRDPDCYGGGGVVSFATVLGDYDEIYKGNKKQHMSNILEKIRRGKVEFSSMVGSSNGGGAPSSSSSSSNAASASGAERQIYVPPIFAAALPEGTSVCPQTGLVTFTNPKTAATLREQLIAEDAEPISFKDFIFFDNQTDNIHNVSRANICSVHVPEGMTMNNWARGLQQWRKEQRPVGGKQYQQHYQSSI